jgi:hypothetical protein
MHDINPYESPREAGVVDPIISPEKTKIARNIRAICFLYIVFGGLAVLGGIGMIADPQGTGVPRFVACLIAIVGCAGIVSAIGVLRRRSWGIVVCQIVSALYLLSFPIGTILGAYFLLNIGKVKEQFN